MLDASFLIVVAVALCLLSGMIVARMAAGGAPPRRIAVPIAEIWLVFILWIAIFGSLSRAIGTPVGAGEAAELYDLLGRFAALHGSARLWAIAGAAVTVAIVTHLMWSLQRTMSQHIRP